LSVFADVNFKKRYDWIGMLLLLSRGTILYDLDDRAMAILEGYWKDMLVPSIRLLGATLEDHFRRQLLP